MNKLFIIDGAAGTGKSDLIEYVEETYPGSEETYPGNVKVVRKFTTRSQRSGESNRKLDLRFIRTSDFKKMIEENELYSYNYGGAKYGISKAELEESIKNYEFTFIIVRNAQLAKIIMDRYSNNVQVIHIFIYTDRSRVQERMQKDGLTTEEINFRLKRTEKTWNDYIENYSPKNKHQILINDSNKANFHRLINEVIKEYSVVNEEPDRLYINANAVFNLLPSLIGFKKEMQKVLKKYPYEKNVFLMMKYRESNAEVYDFIKEELHKRGYNCIRADEPDWDITRDVYNPIAVLYCCKFGIALFDEPEEKQLFSPNVAYELGIMQAQNKNCLILKHESLIKEPFFDLMKDLYKPYSKEIRMKKIFKDWLDSIER